MAERLIGFDNDKRSKCRICSTTAGIRLPENGAARGQRARRMARAAHLLGRAERGFLVGTGSEFPFRWRSEIRQGARRATSNGQIDSGRHNVTRRLAVHDARLTDAGVTILALHSREPTSASSSSRKREVGQGNPGGQHQAELVQTHQGASEGAMLPRVRCEGCFRAISPPAGGPPARRSPQALVPAPPELA